MGIQINGNTNNINAGIGSLSIEDINELDIVGVATAANFKTGTSNLHSTGLTLSGGQLDVGSNIKLGNAGVITATSFVGSGANLTSLPAQATIANNADNRVITGGSGVNLNGESGLTYNGTRLDVTTGDLQVIGGEGGNAELRIVADQGDDGADYWRFQSNASSDNKLNIATYASGSWVDKITINTDGKIGINATSPSAYARVHLEDANGVLIAGDGQSRILMRNNTGGTNEKMMDIQCNGNINFRTINDDYTTATTRATFRTDGNFVVGNRVGTSSPSTNQPVAFHSARVTPDTASSTLSNGVRCNLYVGSNSGWQVGDGGVIGMGGSRDGYAGQEAMWGYIKGSRQSGNGWEYAGRLELGTAEWGTYNTTKAVSIYADNQIEQHGKDNTMYSGRINGAVRVRLQHSGNNMTLSNPSGGNFTFDTSSDYRLKENVVGISSALTTVKALKPYQYTWKHDNKLGQGFLAHEAQEVLPDVGIVSGTKDAVQTEDDTKHDGQWKKGDPIYQQIDYSKLVPLLTAVYKRRLPREKHLKQESLPLRDS